MGSRKRIPKSEGKRERLINPSLSKGFRSGAIRITWVCPDCNAKLGGSEVSHAQMAERLHRHRQEKHKNVPAQAPLANRPLLICPECKVPVREDRLRRHLSRMYRSDSVQIARMLEALLRHRSAASEGPAKREGLEDNQTKVERLPFELLPPGTWDLEHVIAYYREAASRFPSDLAGREIEWARLERLKSLKPAKCYVGKESWLGYVVFEFQRSKRVVLECPIKGNAAYVLWGEWKKMVAHTKLFLRTQFPHNYTKIVHKGEWLSRIRAAL